MAASTFHTKVIERTVLVAASFPGIVVGIAVVVLSLTLVLSLSFSFAFAATLASFVSFASTFASLLALVLSCLGGPLLKVVIIEG